MQVAGGDRSRFDNLVSQAIQGFALVEYVALHQLLRRTAYNQVESQLLAIEQFLQHRWQRRATLDHIWKLVQTEYQAACQLAVECHKQRFPIGINHLVKTLNPFGYGFGKQCALVYIRGLVTKKIDIALLQCQDMFEQSGLAYTAPAV